MTHTSIRRLLAIALASALILTASMATFASAEDSGKHFSIVEAASLENALSIPEIAKKCRTSVVAIETETTVVYNNSYGNDFYSPFGSMFGFPGFGYGYPTAAASSVNTPRPARAPASSSPRTATS